LFSGPSLSNKLPWEFPRDYPVEILERNENWCKIREHDGFFNWMSCSLLSDKKTVLIIKASSFIKKALEIITTISQKQVPE